ncbi:MAG: M23 family metallopeptidase [bacterium]|nr:M23 family metallopeptidase [bacterium]
MRRRFSILIVSSSGGRTKTYTISQLVAWILCGIFICIFGGAGWLIFEYGNILKKSLEIKALKDENQKLRKEYEKLIAFEREFNEFKLKTVKIANMLGIEHTETTQNLTEERLTAQFTLDPSANRQELYSNPSSEADDEVKTILEEAAKEQRLIPSIYPVKGWITRRFSPEHPGIDFAAPFGTPVFATMDGVVEFVGFDESLGNLVEVTNDNGFTTVYGHLARVNVENSSKISRGDLIGFVGTTGKSFAPHLHYEVQLNRVPQNPERYLIK